MTYMKPDMHIEFGGGALIDTNGGYALDRISGTHRTAFTDNSIFTNDSKGIYVCEVIAPNEGTAIVAITASSAGTPESGDNIYLVVDKDQGYVYLSVDIGEQTFGGNTTTITTLGGQLAVDFENKTVTFYDDSGLFVDSVVWLGDFDGELYTAMEIGQTATENTIEITYNKENFVYVTNSAIAGVFLQFGQLMTQFKLPVADRTVAFGELNNLVAGVKLVINTTTAPITNLASSTSIADGTFPSSDWATYSDTVSAQYFYEDGGEIYPPIIKLSAPVEFIPPFYDAYYSPNVSFSGGITTILGSLTTGSSYEAVFEVGNNGDSDGLIFADAGETYFNDTIEGKLAAVSVGDLTIAIRFKATTLLTGTNQTLISNNKSPFDETEDTNFNYMLRISSDGKLDYFHEQVSGSNTTVTTDFVFNNNQEYDVHLIRTITQAGCDIELFVDNVSVKTESVIAPLGGSLGTLHVGGSGVNIDRFTGEVQGFVIAKDILTSEQITAVFNSFGSAS